MMTKHQYYLQLRKDILEERVRCDLENSMILASLALQAEFGDYQTEVQTTWGKNRKVLFSRLRIIFSTSVFFERLLLPTENPLTIVLFNSPYSLTITVVFYNKKMWFKPGIFNTILKQRLFWPSEHHINSQK